MSSNLTITRICYNCGKEFIAKTTSTKYCSHKCNSRHYKIRQRESKIESSNKQTETIRAIPYLNIKDKEYLSIADVCQLTGVSRTTLWRMEANQSLVPGRFNKRKLFRKTDIDRLFTQPSDNIPNSEEKNENQISHTSEELSSIRQILKTFSISRSCLDNVIKRNNIQKIKRGKEVLVPISEIIKILNLNQPII